MKALENIGFYFIAAFLIAVSLISGYFILANTVLADKITPAVAVSGIGFETKASNPQDISIELAEFLVADGYSEVDLKFADLQVTVPVTSELIDIASAEELESYGKGKDISKVVADGAKWLLGDTIEIGVSLDLEYIESYLPFSQSNAATLTGTKLINCESGKYDFSLPDSAQQSLLKALASGNTFDVSSVLSKGDIALINACKRYTAELGSVRQGLSDLGLSTNITAEYDINSGWQLSGSQLRDYLYDLKRKQDVAAYDGQYEVHGSSLYFFDMYRSGSQLNVDASLANINNWLQNPTDSISGLIVTNEVNPQIINTPGVRIYDFSKKLASGKTRIDIIRNGSPNWVLPYAQYGVEDMNNRIIAPGQEFSYIDAINPQPGGWMASGKPIGSGICNSSTTLFRAALEAGFKITDRSYHPTYIRSYEWGYPMNLVDAVYLTDPRIDMKFVNDLEYPVLMRATIDRRDGEGWQYHTIDMYTSSEAPDRSVELYDFRKWNVISDHKYEGEFKRKVYDNGVLVRSDSFYSKYV